MTETTETFLVGLISTSIAIGYITSAAWGLLFFGLVNLTIGILGMISKD